MTRVKICGVTREDDLRVAVEAGADAVGIVAAVPVDTPREVPVADAADLLAAVPPFVSGVLVTMPDSTERALDLVRETAPDAIQVHGDRSAESAAAVAAETDVDVLLAVDADEPDAARRAANAADGLVVDSTGPEGAGGTGRTHDWGRTRRLVAELDVPVVLAGGLTPRNVADAAAMVRPFAVDVSTGVERAGGAKDHDAVRRFVEGARRAEATV